MSHMSRNSKVNVTSISAFELACRDLGYTEFEKNTPLKAYDGSTVETAIKVWNTKHTYAAGLAANKSGTYDIVSDWWGFQQGQSDPMRAELRLGGSEEEALLKYTTKHTIMQQYAAKGFLCQAAHQKDGSIRMTLTR